jgi:DNA polymerase-3 subunit alpha
MLKNDEPLLIGGTVELGETRTKIISQELVPLETVRRKAIKAVSLSIHEKNLSRPVLEALQGIVFRYPGESRLYFKIDTEKGKEVLISADKRFRVLPCRDFISEIEALTDCHVRKMTSEPRFSA